MKQKTGKRFLLCAVMLLAVMLLAVPTQAAARYKKQWKKQNQNIYYYNEKGKKLTGLSKIGKKTFYFDKKVLNIPQTHFFLVSYFAIIKSYDIMSSVVL